MRRVSWFAAVPAMLLGWAGLAAHFAPATAAAEVYLGVTKAKISVGELVAVIRQPGAIFTATPQRSMLWAEYMHRIGLIKQEPASWKDFSFPGIHDRNGS